MAGQGLPGLVCGLLRLQERVLRLSQTARRCSRPLLRYVQKLMAAKGYTDATREQDGADDGRRTQLQVRAVGWRHGWARVS